METKNKSAEKPDETPNAMPDEKQPVKKESVTQPEGEIGGPSGPEPTRYGDWEKGGRCSDF